VRRSLLLVLLAVCVLSTGRASAERRPLKRVSLRTQPSGPTTWCAPEFEALDDDVCHVGASPETGRRTLVIFLHGAIAKDTTWQWTQQRALARQAKQSHFEAIFPRAPLGERGYLWPGSVTAQKEHEQALVEGWTAARRKLEAKSGRPFDDVFVMGFSSGAYFVSSLALRGRLDVDGYAVFAGGAAAHGPSAEAPHRPPVFVGVCSDDPQTAAHSRAFGGALAANGIPHRIDERHVGHMFADAHVAHAVAFLRGARRGAASD
jgi:predicted esterase